ncbi:MAG: hypothetical protein WCJ56_05905 [bacterium]
MSVEDKQIWRALERELTRRQDLDLSDTKVVVQRGIGYISGIIRPQQGAYIVPREEIKAIMETSRRVPGLKDIVIDARFVIDTKK